LDSAELDLSWAENLGEIVLVLGFRRLPVEFGLILPMRCRAKGGLNMVAIEYGQLAGDSRILVHCPKTGVCGARD
jgi:hypothetical protein